MSAEGPAHISQVREASQPLSDLNLEFRAVVGGGKRRGIKLERAFWRALKWVTKEKGTTAGAFIDDVAAQVGQSHNLTSALRVACLSAYADKLERLQSHGPAATIAAVIAASPSPVFTLGANRRIVAFNAPFQALVRRQFMSGTGETPRLDLRLTLDVAVEDIIARLIQNGNTPVATGYVIGMGEKRHRGLVNTIRVPSSDAELLMAFVAG